MFGRDDKSTAASTVFTAITAVKGAVNERRESGTAVCVTVIPIKPHIFHCSLTPIDFRGSGEKKRQLLRSHCGLRMRVCVYVCRGAPITKYLR